MSASPDRSPIPDAVRERAAAWHVRLASDEATGADWLDFETWLAADPLHRRAYEAVETVWSLLDEAPVSAATNVASLPRRPNRRVMIWWGSAAASLAAVAVVGGAYWSSLPRPVSFDTAPGERRTVTLAEGTRITLNGGSHLQVTLGRHERRVVMADAEAAFDVAKDPDRPFFIEAGDREIRVVGTEFNVLRHKGQVAVTVRRGVVEVRPKDAPKSAPLARLTKGQALSHREGQEGDKLLVANPDDALAWTTGRLVFHDRPLAEVATTLSRYTTRPVTVAPDAQALPVTAVLNIGSDEAMLGSLSAFLPVRVEQRPDSVRLSLRR